MWDKVFKSGPSKICGRQPLKNLKGYGADHFKRLSSTDFTWSTLEYLVPFKILLTIIGHDHATVNILYYYIQINSIKILKKIHNDNIGTQQWKHALVLYGTSKTDTLS